VDYAAVSTAGVKATRNFFFQQRYASVRETTFQLAGYANPNNTATQNQKISRTHGSTFRWQLFATRFLEESHKCVHSIFCGGP
jgi:hypothetical protein